jgi:hypothetical protein
MTARPTVTAIFAAVGSVLLAGCARTLLFTTTSVLGVDMNVGEGGQETVKVGINRFDGVSMPACIDDQPWYSTKACLRVMPKAYATLSVYDVNVGWQRVPGLASTDVTQVFATGHAALDENAMESVAGSVAAIKGVNLVPPDVLKPVSRLIKALKQANSVEQQKLIAAVNRHLAKTAAKPGEAQALIDDAAEDEHQRAKLIALLQEVEETVSTIETRRAGVPAMQSPDGA